MSKNNDAMNQVLDRFVEAYIERDNDETFVNWLADALYQELPPMTGEDCYQLSQEIVDGFNKNQVATLGDIQCLGGFNKETLIRMEDTVPNEARSVVAAVLMTIAKEGFCEALEPDTPIRTLCAMAQALCN